MVMENNVQLFEMIGLFISLTVDGKVFDSYQNTRQSKINMYLTTYAADRHMLAIPNHVL